MALKWVGSFLRGRTQRITIGEFRSELKSLSRGSVQGSLLSPILFLIYISDMGKFVTNSRLSCYADDSTASFKDKTITVLKAHLEIQAANMLEFTNANLLKMNGS